MAVIVQYKQLTRVSPMASGKSYVKWIKEWGYLEKILDLAD